MSLLFFGYLAAYQNVTVLNAEFQPVQRPWWRSANNITIYVKTSIVAGAMEYLVFLIPVIGTIQVGTAGVENNEFPTLLMDYPGTFAQGADIPAVTYSLLISYKRGFTYRDIIDAGNRPLWNSSHREPVTIRPGCHLRCPKYSHPEAVAGFSGLEWR